MSQGLETARIAGAAVRVGRWVALVVAISSLAAATANAQSLHASVGGGAVFPSRSLLVSAQGVSNLSAARVHVTENGQRIANLSVTSLRNANRSDFGVILLIDTDATMRGAPLDQAVAAARRLAAQRTGNEQLGVMFGDRISLALTSDPAAIDQALSQVPQRLSSTDLLRDATSAVNQLKTANIADGAIIYVSDDIDRDPAYTPQSVAAFANAAHVPIFVVGIRDAAFAHPLPNDLSRESMALLANNTGGAFTAAAPSELTQIFTTIEARQTSKYIVRYRSVQPLGREIVVSLHIDGLEGAFSTTYRSPSPAPGLLPKHVTPAQPQSFWTSSFAVALEAVVCALLIGVAAALLVKHFATTGELRARVEEFIPLTKPDRVELPVQLAEEPAALATRSWWLSLAEDVDVGRIQLSPAALVQLAAFVSVVVAMLLTLVTGSAIVGIPGLLAGPLVLRTVVNYNVRRQRALFSTQLAAHLEEVAGAMRAGRSLVEALAAVAEAAEEPTRAEFDRALADERLGRPLDDSLRPIAQRMRSPDVEQLAVIAALHRGSGANVAEVLDHIAAGARQRDEMRRELRTMTAQARLTRWILSLLPVVMLLGLTLLRPSYERPLLHTGSGRLVLVFGATLVLLGSYVMSRIVDIEV